MIKFIEVESQFQVGISKGLNSSVVRWCSALAFLANQSFIHIFCNFSFYIITPKILPQICVHIGAPLVHQIASNMSLL